MPSPIPSPIPSHAHRSQRDAQAEDVGQEAMGSRSGHRPATLMSRLERDATMGDGNLITLRTAAKRGMQD
jgi:hypothetical protein